MNREFENLHKQFTSKQRYQLVMRLTGDEVEPLIDSELKLDKAKWTPLMSQKVVNQFVQSEKHRLGSEAFSAVTSRSAARTKGSNIIGTRE